MREFEATLRREPNRFRTLAGAARAADLAGGRDAARTYYMALLALGVGADTDRPELARAKQAIEP